jgi:hypothetical protein
MTDLWYSQDTVVRCDGDHGLLSHCGASRRKGHAASNRRHHQHAVRDVAVASVFFLIADRIMRLVVTHFLDIGS